MIRDAHRNRAAHDCLSGGGNMGALMRETDWGATPFGHVETWPQSLRTAVSIMLESRFAVVVAWGPDFRFFYNDRYQPILGAKHPAALGRAGAEIFPEVWAVVGPEFERVRRGESLRTSSPMAISHPTTATRSRLPTATVYGCESW